MGVGAVHHGAETHAEIPRFKRSKKTCSPFSSVLEFVCLPWSEVCSARVSSIIIII